MKSASGLNVIELGAVKIDARQYASQGNAILGIRDSGKSYTATYIAERLFEAGAPFTAFDPIGVWRFLRVAGKGHGYPVVVAGGEHGDLPLTPASAPEIARAAMREGMSLIIDLFSMELSKADWKRIVQNCVRVLLYENKPHGLRHIFIEEAAEFAPQRVGPDQGAVYAEIEKLARMGGNALLGYTLINQRAEEVNKAVLELCDNLILHRQKGRNSLTALTKWLDIADAKGAREIVKSLPTLPQGEAWVWAAGTLAPIHVKIPAKSSFHPDRRAMRDDDAVAARPAVDVAEFVARLSAALGKDAPKPKEKPKPKEAHVTEQEAARLRAENAELKRRLSELEKRQSPTTPAAPVNSRHVTEDLDIEALYQTIKARLVDEAPAIIRVLAQRPEIEVAVERKTLTVEGDSLKGRLARLIAGGFFDEGRTQGATRAELKRTGPDVNQGSLWKTLAALQADGFVTKESGENYRAVPDMKINVVER